MDAEKKIAETHLTPIESHAVGRLGSIHGEGTKRKIKSRHAQMIAIGGTIGTGLFVGSGQALATAGPGLLLASYCLITLLVYGIITAVVEVCAFLPVSGSSMSYYCARFVSPSLGFALGWLYFYSFGIIAAYEITAASLVINFWPNQVPEVVWITIMLLVIVGLNVAPVGIYAETEFWFAGVKVVMILGLLVLSLVLMCGGGPSGEVIGFHYWDDPGAVKAYLVAGAGGRFTAFLWVWVFSGFAFYFGPELMIFTAGEMQNPRKNLPTAARRFFIRLVIFYVLGALAIGIICNSDSQGLVSDSGNANASPWVIAIRNAGILWLDSVVNVGILLSAWSSGNSYLFMATRSLYSQAIVGNAPAIFMRCTKYGLPIYSLIASSLFCLLAYLSVGSQAGVAFDWFISLTNTAGFTSWILCCVVFIRFRKACDVQGVSVPYRSRFQPVVAWVCLGFFVFLLLINGFTVFYPGQFTASGFLVTYLGIPIFCILWLGHKIIEGRRDPWLFDPAEVDLITGIREIEADEQIWAESAALQRENRRAGNKAWNVVKVLWE